MSTGMIEKARREVLKKEKREAHVDSGSQPGRVAKNGSKVKIVRGDEINDAGTTTVSNLGGQEARVDGQPYVAKGGPNAGKVIQPVRVEDTGAILGVPSDRLVSAELASTGHSRPCVGWSPTYEQSWERIFGKRKPSRR